VGKTLRRRNHPQSSPTISLSKEAGSEGNPVDPLRIDQPAGQRVRFHMQHPVAIFSRLKLNGLARVSQRFYRGQIFGDSVLERMVSLTAQSASFRDLMSDLFAGIQGYRDLRARLYKILPAVMTEGLAGSLCWPWNGSDGSEFAAEPD
jgi:hypothetical protein